MQLFLTGVLPFLAHDHPAAAAFLTCRHDNFHASIIPEFLSDEERVRKFCEVRQQNQLEPDEDKQYTNLYSLFVQTPLMQFSPSLLLCQKDCAESILKPLLSTKYFTRTLQRCSVGDDVSLKNDLLQALSKVQSLTKLDLSWCANKQLEIIIKYFPSLSTLTIQRAEYLDPSISISISSSPPPATKTLRNLTMREVDPLFAAQFVPHFTNLRKIVLRGHFSCPELDLLALSSSLPLLTDLSLFYYTLGNVASLKNLVHLSSLKFFSCNGLELSFLTQNNILPHLTQLLIYNCHAGLSKSSFASLSHAPNLRVLEIVSESFDNDCLQYLENMVHLQKLDLNHPNIAGESRLLKDVIPNLLQLEELNLRSCHIGNQGEIAGALYSTHSRLRVLNLRGCYLVDDDLNGIGALKNTLEVLDLNFNHGLTNESLVRCRELVKLKILSLFSCGGIDDLSPIKDCLNLEELNLLFCEGLTDDSFKIFSEEPNSFPNLRMLNLSGNEGLSEQMFAYLSKNNNLVYQLKELDIWDMSETVSSATARNNICKLKGLQILKGVLDSTSSDSDRNNLKAEVMRSLKNLEEIS